MAGKTAINPTREENFPEWYQQVVKAAELADNSDVRGCMVIRPWGYGIWELLQKELDQRIKATGHENAYFPLFIPLSYLEKEAAHVEGFAKECAVVTHHRLSEKDGKLVPDGELEEPLIVRPTSETIIGASFAKWVQSYRDLPLLINQWANVVRWEMRTRVFLRTAEFLWQEGHTVHASSKEAQEEMKLMIDVYRELAEEVLAIPVIPGTKSEDEKFPGAVTSMTIEAMMQDGKALQAGTSHYLGQNFAKASGIKFLNQAGEQEFGYTTSWGVSTRLMGGMIMTHGDDDGLKIPPKVAPQQIVILPVIPKEDQTAEVLEYADKIAAELSSLNLRVKVDKRDLRGGEKSWNWVKKGVPVRLEAGPRDIPENKVVLYRRDQSAREKEFLSIAELKENINPVLNEIHNNYFQSALSYRNQNIYDNIKTYTELEEFFNSGNTGFIKAKWNGDISGVEKLKALKLSIRCIPSEQRNAQGKCLLSGENATMDCIFAKAY